MQLAVAAREAAVPLRTAQRWLARTVELTEDFSARRPRRAVCGEPSPDYARRVTTKAAALVSSHEDSSLRRYLTTSTAIAIAEGVLIERHPLSTELAHALLQSTATARGLPLCEAANWLLTIDTLP